MLKTFSRLKEYVPQGNRFVHLTQTEIKGLQTVLLDMLIDFHNICKKNNLTYFLTGGSALGARRHQGFIPWDDDIDIFMPREDYEKLREVIRIHYAGKYWIQNLHTSPKYDLNFTKLRKIGTKYVELYETEPERAGICIDIYPLDGTHQNQLIRFFDGIVNEAFFFIASCVRMYQKKEKLLMYIGDAQLARAIKIKSYIGKLFNSSKNPRKWYLYCEKWCNKANSSHSKFVVASSGRGHYFGEMYDRNRLFPPVLADFEGHQVYIPQDIDYLLRILYGDNYLLLPKERKKESHALLEVSIITEEREGYNE